MNIVFIGMPGAGKTVIGKRLAENLGLNFIDGDDYIKHKLGQRLQKIIDEQGEQEFNRIEKEKIGQLLPLQNTVLSPGGSIIYSDKIMTKLANSSTIIFLDVCLEVLLKRIKNKERRGIVGLKSKKFSQVFKERRPKYIKYSDFIINGNKNKEEEVNNIMKRLK